MTNPNSMFYVEVTVDGATLKGSESEVRGLLKMILESRERVAAMQVQQAAGRRAAKGETT